MMSLERSVLFLIVYLTIFFNIERVDLGQTNVIDISSVVYVMVLLALIVILTVPGILRLPLSAVIVLWVVLYLGTRLAIFPWYHRHIWGGIYTYLTITEVSLSTITIILTYQVRRQLNDFKQAVENLTLAGLTHRIQHKNEAMDDIQKELLRSRRHNYPLSVMVVEPDPATVKLSLNRSVVEVQKAMMTRYVITNIMRLASNLFRRTDLIVDQVIDKDSFVVVLTDTDGEKAGAVAQRFQDLVEQGMGVKIGVGLATFPDEGLTFESLVDKANERIPGQPKQLVEQNAPSDVPLQGK